MPQQVASQIDNQIIAPAVWVFSLHSKDAPNPDKAGVVGHIEITDRKTLSDLADTFYFEVFKDYNASEGRITCSTNTSLVLYFHEDHPKMMMVLPKGTRKHKSKKGFA
ncbi:hypothetical protein Syn8016DRAFT_0781 [Synechococcus sp. WH 8016]|nr:hypothetical protein Syn8016DRAFT_0781 [Synechococcus sp. WH 8016]